MYASAFTAAAGDLAVLEDSLTVTNATANSKVVGVFMKSTAPGAIADVIVRGKVKLTAGGYISAGAGIKAGGASVVVAAVNTVTIPIGTTTVASTSAQPSMTVESSICFGIAFQASAMSGDSILCSINCAH